MVLESLLTAEVVEKVPAKMLPLSMLYSSIAIAASLWLFPDNNLAVIAFTVMFLLPLMIDVMKFEEKKEERSKKIIPLTEHRTVLPFFLFMFAGLILSFVLWFLLLPHDTVARLFNAQLNTLSQVSVVISGDAVSTNALFTKIFLNNLRVMSIAIIFSLLYGAGAIFIITWNASLIGVTIANTIRTLVAGANAGYFGAFSISMARYMLHGVPEIAAYFIAGLAGSIISASLIKKQFGTEKFTHALLDSFSLIALAILILLVAAVIEVTISPLISF